MLQMRKYLLAGICTAIFFACSAPDRNAIPQDVMNKQLMESVIFDMHVAEGVITTEKMQGDSSHRKVLGLYQKVFKKYGITQEQFYKSYDFYVQHPVLLDSIYNNIISNLSEQESLYRK